MLEKSRMFKINHALTNQELIKSLPSSSCCIIDNIGTKDNKMTGTIKRVLDEKKFGFIRGENDKEYFVHASACNFPLNDMQIGKNVRFENNDGYSKGPRAEKVELI